MSNFCWVKLTWPDGAEYAVVLEKGRSVAPLRNLELMYDLETTVGEDLSPEETRLWDALRTARIKRWHEARRRVAALST